jgi:hypothetical protein
MGVKCMCGYEKEREHCTVIRLSTEEKKQLLAQGHSAPSELFYCPPCLRVLQDPEQGPKLMRGVREQMLLASGVPKQQAKELADEFYEGLLQQTKNTHGPKS